VGDYAVCIGTTGFDYTYQLAPGTKSIPPDGAFVAYVGIRFAEISDGLSSTLMVGEKHVPWDSWGLFPWDCSLYDGHNPICNTRSAGPGYPLAASQFDPGLEFGSAHPGICQFVFCDGSVHILRNSIDPVTLGLLAQRNDGQAVNDY
jgi:hypothetical protein